MGTPAGVIVVGQLAIDEMEISLLDANRVENLTQWLAENGYRFPTDGTPVLARYIDESWKFLAIKINASALEATGGMIDGYLPHDPLKITFPCLSPVFPLQISSINSAQDGSEVLLYVFAPHRMASTSYPCVEMSFAGVSMTDEKSFRQSYAGQFATLLDQPGGRAFVAEYAHPVVGNGYPGICESGRQYFLTRMRSRLLPEHMTKDLTLMPASSDAGLELFASAGTCPILAQGVFALLLTLMMTCLARVSVPTPRTRPRWTAMLFLALLLFGAIWGT